MKQLEIVSRIVEIAGLNQIKFNSEGYYCFQDEEIEFETDVFQRKTILYLAGYGYMELHNESISSINALTKSRNEEFEIKYKTGEIYRTRIPVTMCGDILEWDAEKENESVDDGDEYYPDTDYVEGIYQTAYANGMDVM